MHSSLTEAASIFKTGKVSAKAGTKEEVINSVNEYMKEGKDLSIETIFGGKSTLREKSSSYYE
ncbi:hypothetical protein J2S78_002847 [Salibacterium salarium]|uniref:hypothetical protein n=1 Tax=Salibacterium salarium TaxID=284579 RepID=UPI002781476F|nr:hypothetical protein [Salibacterium salarium]MDQ0300400.1 hypothetical protein [Salibacterium salarium]